MHKKFFLVLLFLTACTKYEPESGYPASKTETDNVNGFQVYQQNCVACHGSDGTGAFSGVPNLTQVAGFNKTSHSDTDLFQHREHIRKGVKTPGSPIAMPANGGNPNLTDQDIRDVLKYMRNKFMNE